MSKSAGKKPKEKSDKTNADNFVWTDDEVQLLLEVTNDYKVSTAAKNIDWESCQSKYTDILESSLFALTSASKSFYSSKSACSCG